MGIASRIAALLGISAYTQPTLSGVTPNAEAIEQVRRQYGGSLQPLPQSQTRWYLHDLEVAEHNADAGQLASAARLMRAARKDGTLAGVLSTRTDGLVRLPKRFRGDPEIVAALELGHDQTRSVFDEMCPATELGLVAADGVLLGVGVGELVPVKGRGYPLFVRLDPEFLVYIWNENRWYFRSIAGLVPITPGDGRWVLHVPGGRCTPWHHGLWRAVGRAYIRKEHASIHKDNWEAKLANPARVAVAPQGASEKQKESWFKRVMAWGVNTVFGLTPGYDVKLLESNGRGADSFQKTIAEQNDEFKMAVAGQLVTSDGGAGFQNSDIHRSIRADLIKATSDALAYTVNTQILPSWIVSQWGTEALDSGGAVVEWDVTPPKDRASDAQALTTVGAAISALSKALSEHGRSLDIDSLASRFGIPLEVQAAECDAPVDVSVKDISAAIDIARAAGLQPTEESIRKMLERIGVELEEIEQGAMQPGRLALAPEALSRIIKGDEARASQGLAPFGDERDQKTVAELGKHEFIHMEDVVPGSEDATSDAQPESEAA